MGNSPSLRASIQKGHWDVVHKVLETQDGADRARNKSYPISNETMSALQMACRYKAPASIVQRLVAIGQPMSASRPSQLTPLHYAVMTRNPSPQVVTILLRAFPGDVATRSSPIRQTPLHMACLNRAPTEIMQLLHESDPSAAAEIRNAQGETAWQAACTNSWILHPIWRRKVKRIFMEQQQQQPRSPRAARTPVPGRARPPPASARPPPTSARLLPPTSIVVEATPVPRPRAGHPGGIPAAIIVETIPLVPTAPPDSLLEEDLCVLCFEHKVEMALIPCGHVCLCHFCCDDHTLNEFLQRKCPVCRQPFRDPLRIYSAGISVN